MSRNDLHQSPPLEAYSRVTNPGRFQPLHALALELIERLEADYEVIRTNVFAPAPGWRLSPPERL